MSFFVLRGSSALEVGLFRKSKLGHIIDSEWVLSTSPLTYDLVKFGPDSIHFFTRNTQYPLHFGELRGNSRKQSFGRPRLCWGTEDAPISFATARIGTLVNNRVIAQKRESAGTTGLYRLFST
jgi:hypothetical protein